MEKSRRGSGEDLTEQEIMSMVNEGHEHGVLQESEAEMINNNFLRWIRKKQKIL